MKRILFIVMYNFITGTLCLIYGVKFMSSGLLQFNTQKIKKVLSVYTDRLIPSVIAGTVITALLQSSTAVTVIAVGLVNSGVMKLAQAVGIVYGANIGTTITTQLMSFKITYLGIPICLAGLLMRFLLKKNSLKNISLSVMGLGLMFTGINILSSGAPYIKESVFLYNLFKTYGKNLYIGIIIGAAVTMLVHSSSAAVGLTIVLFNSGLIGLDAAIGLTLGDNIGTCISAQLASIGTCAPARQTAWAHTLYNVVGVLIALMFLTPFSDMVKSITALLGQDESKLVANAHTIFNILSAVAFMPITKYYVKLIEFIVPDNKQAISRKQKALSQKLN